MLTPSLSRFWCLGPALILLPLEQGPPRPTSRKRKSCACNRERKRKRPILSPSRLVLSLIHSLYWSGLCQVSLYSKVNKFKLKKDSPQILLFVNMIDKRLSDWRWYQISADCNIKAPSSQLKAKASSWSSAQRSGPDEPWKIEIVGLCGWQEQLIGKLQGLSGTRTRQIPRQPSFCTELREYDRGFFHT